MPVPRNYVVIERFRHKRCTGYVEEGTILRLMPDAAEHLLNAGVIRKTKKRDYDGLKWLASGLEVGA